MGESPMKIESTFREMDPNLVFRTFAESLRQGKVKVEETPVHLVVERAVADALHASRSAILGYLASLPRCDYCAGDRTVPCDCVPIGSHWSDSRHDEKPGRRKMRRACEECVLEHPRRFWRFEYYASERLFVLIRMVGGP